MKEAELTLRGLPGSGRSVANRTRPCELWKSRLSERTSLPRRVRSSSRPMTLGQRPDALRGVAGDLLGGRAGAIDDRALTALLGPTRSDEASPDTQGGGAAACRGHRNPARLPVHCGDRAGNCVRGPRRRASRLEAFRPRSEQLHDLASRSASLQSDPSAGLSPGGRIVVIRPRGRGGARGHPAHLPCELQGRLHLSPARGMDIPSRPGRVSWATS